MKGDYTVSVFILSLPVDGDHPQMKGDYTPRFTLQPGVSTETTPK